VSAAVASLVGDGSLRKRLADAGREHAAAFTWERTAQATLASYERAAAR
jgi:glycosyltransferase involved in cell wall biosynthesis